MNANAGGDTRERREGTPREVMAMACRRLVEGKGRWFVAFVLFVDGSDALSRLLQSI